MKAFFFFFQLKLPNHSDQRQVWVSHLNHQVSFRSHIKSRRRSWYQSQSLRSMNRRRWTLTMIFPISSRMTKIIPMKFFKNVSFQFNFMIKPKIRQPSFSLSCNFAWRRNGVGERIFKQNTCERWFFYDLLTVLTDFIRRKSARKHSILFAVYFTRSSS